jgi:Tol biopolymer transport system component
MDEDGTSKPGSAPASEPTQVATPQDGIEALLRKVAQAPAMAPAREEPAPPPLPEQIGHYRILGPLGRGGMGDVFRAHDTLLDRTVALKILPGELARDAAQVRRFTQEAKAASALNHPHIITIYEIQEFTTPQGSVLHTIAMELVQGETLREWLRIEKPPLSRVIDVFAQVALGLAKAHSAGIVHRDLKPENIMVTEDGFAKILDFGLAKLLGPPLPAPSPGRDAALTRTGMIVGTVGYMAPEQVEGLAVDGRADVFAFGCILFEALSGQRPFGERSALDTLHAIVHQEAPSLSCASGDLTRIVERCLAKRPEDRYQSARDLAADLRHAQRTYEEAGAPPPPVASAQAVRRTRRRLRLWAIATAAAAALGAAAVLALRYLPRTGEDRGAPRRSEAGAALRIERLTYSGKATYAALSPDGRVVAHVVDAGDKSSLWIRQVATGSSLSIVPEMEGSIRAVTISPDGDYAYYVVRKGHELVNTLYRVPILGGPPRRVLADVDCAVAFSPDGRELAFVRFDPNGRTSSLLRAPAGGGEERLVAKLPLSTLLGSPAWSPDGRWIGASARAAGTMRFEIRAFPVDGGKARSVTAPHFAEIDGLAWAPDGKALVVAAAERLGREGQIWYVPDPGGPPRRLTQDPSSYHHVSLSRDGKTLVTSRVTHVSNLWVAGTHEGAPQRQITSGAGHYHSLAWTPDGRIVYSALQDGAWDLWIADADGRRAERLTADAGANFDPAISPDGRSVAFVSDRAGSISLWIADLGGGPPRRLSPGNYDIAPTFTPDGRFVVYTSVIDENQTLWRIPAAGGTPLRITSFHTRTAAVSPDGRLLAAAYWDGRPESTWKLAVLPFEGGQPRQLFALPPTASLSVRWTPDGAGLSYSDSREGIANIWVQPLGGPPRRVTEFNSDSIFGHAWAPDGKRLAVVRGLRSSDVAILRGLL